MTGKAEPSTAFDGPGRIDVHHHCFPGTLEELQSEFEHNSYNLNYSPFPQGPEEHLEYMDRVGIQTAVITPSIKREWHEGLSAAAFAGFCRRSLDAQLAYVKYNPVRFGCFAILPLPHVQECIDFIRHTQTLETKPEGFAVATAMGKTYLGDAQLDAVWEELDRSGSMVFVHPSDTAMPPNLNFGPFVEEFPFDTCRAITSVINAGILIRMPNVRFLFSHNGGAFPYLADRIGVQHLDNVITKTNSGKNMREILSSSNIFFDTSISSPMQYPLIKDLCIPVEHLLYATDYPYTMRFDNDTYLAGFDAPKKSGVFSDEEMNKILYRNSLAVFPRLKALYDQFWP